MGYQLLVALALRRGRSSSAFLVGGGRPTTKLAFVVSLNKPGGAVTLNYTTVSGSAVSPADFKAKTGTLTFTATAVAKVVTISIVADDLKEGDESFKLVISGISGGTISDDTGIGTVIDDD